MGASGLGFIPIVGGVAKKSVQAGIKETAQSSAKEVTQTIAKKSINDLPDNVQDIYKKYEKNGWQGNVSGQTQGTKAGAAWKNDGSDGAVVLPKKDASGKGISYKEFDINNKIAGQSRDAERFLKGSDGTIYYTNDHYRTVTKVE
ncbi:ribonuclease domain-containing protein [Enterococcus termitis]|uniref:Uncharacterized protein n=1 Tax=Enterococcus termitis TaxID=332950 RepID=A0A1E5GCP0_9ENTE|nr:ribonuclease domain-containing protein [Enterococcus termitis]OEG10462.1 hypothetical protein BCR25_08255 [Enterococcus termitis]OJG97442.1 hypothetical protein RV18_GL000723 [Enterococcus termitis]